MIKVLLAFEDYNELTLTESYLKKVGFDVVGISNEVLIQDQILSFNPDIIVAFGKNQKVSSFSVGQKMKENHRYHGRVVIIVPKDVRPTANDMLKMKMDAIIEAPVAPDKLIQVLCRLSSLSPAGYLEKLSKARLSDPQFERKLQSLAVELPPPEAIRAEDGSSAVPMISPAFQDPQRAKKYDDIVQKFPLEVEKTSHSRHDIREKQKVLEKDWNYQQLDHIDDLKREFAEALFKKK